MSDALLERLALAAEGILAHLKKGGSAAGAATPPKTPATGGAATGAGNKGANTAGAAGNKPGAAAGNKPAAGKGAATGGPAAGTKAPGGKHTVEEVRDMIRKVATNAGLGKQSATDVLDQDGGGVQKVTDLKPEFYDAVYEACQVLLNGEGSSAPEQAPEDDLM